MFSKYIWDNIAQENYLCNIGPERTAMILKENSLHNFVLVCLGQDCTKQQPVQCRNNHQRCSVKKVVLKYFAIFTGKHLCWSFFLINWEPSGLHHRCFKVKSEKFLRTLVLKNICKRLLLTMLFKYGWNNIAQKIYLCIVGSDHI